MTTSQDASDARDFEGATFTRSNFKNATVRFSNLEGVRIRECDVNGLEIDSHDLFFGSLIVNGIDVVPLVDAELNRRFPGRELQSATTPEGLRERWAAAKAAWHDTIDATPRERWDEQVGGEWSFAETLRHIVLVIDTWLGRAIEGRERPFHEIGKIFTGAEQGGFDMSIFRVEAPSHDEILEVLDGRERMVEEFLATVTPEQLAEERESPWSGDWRPTVRECVGVILEEWWAHLRYARRDVETMEREGADADAGAAYPPA